MFDGVIDKIKFHARLLAQANLNSRKKISVKIKHSHLVLFWKGVR